MQNYEQIIDDILTILMADVDPSEDALRDVDRRYGEAVAELNVRLADCDRLLHKGHREEAIQECDREPKLLDAVAVLDFPEATQWTEYVRQFGLAGPPEVRADIAADLNDAYTTRAELGDVLRQHRLLALARAPLASRLKVLRQIARQDSGNPIWLEDVRSWEAVRHSQWSRELDEAVSHDDLPGITRLQQELRPELWLVAPPAAIVKSVGDAHRKLRAKQARRQLESLERDLNRAYADFDVQRAREVRQQWQVHAAIGISGAEDPLLDSVTPALDWLAEQDRLEQEQQEYETAMAALESALNQGASPDKLEQLTRAVLAFEHGLPDSLEQRLHQHYAEIDKINRRKRTLRLVSTVISVLVLAAASAWGIHYYGQRSLLADYDSRLQELIESRGLEDAEAVVEEIREKHPHLLGNRGIVGRVKDLEDAKTQEKQRRDLFLQHLDDARKHAETWEGYQDARRELDAAEKQVEKAPVHRQEEEQAELQVARQDVRQNRDTNQKEINEIWRQDFERWLPQVSERDASDREQIKKLLDEGQALRKRLRVEPQVVETIVPHLSELQKSYEELATQQEEDRLLERIAAAVRGGDRTSYVAALRSYIDRLPDRQRAADFRRVLDDESVYWDGIETWNEFIQNLSNIRLNQVSPAQAGELITEAERLLQEHPGFPTETAVKKIIEFLTPVRARVAADGERIARSLLRDLSSFEVVTDFRMLREAQADGTEKRYYFLQDPVVMTNRVEVDSLIDIRFGQTRSKERRIQRHTIRNPKEGQAFDWTSPQQRFHKDLQQQLDPLPDDKWETVFQRIIGQLCREPDGEGNPGIEPVLTVELLARILDTACEGSYAVNRGFRSWKDEIRRAITDRHVDVTANWVDPDNPAGNRARDQATGLLQRIGSLEAASSTVEKTVQAMELEIASLNRQRYHWGGALLRDKAQHWGCLLRTGVRADDNWRLVVIEVAAPGKVVAREIGQLADGRATLTLAPADRQVEGRPVYLVRVP